MDPIPFSIAAAIGSILCAVIGALWKYILTLQKQLREGEETKLQMVLKEAKEAKDLALKIVDVESFRNELLKKIETMNEMIKEFLKGK